ncbi:MAG: hypothetical protein WA705_14895 [Candidatus Ozemobacteraceae bacterium]
MTHEMQAQNRTGRERVFQVFDSASGTLYSRDLFEKDLYRESVQDTLRHDLPNSIPQSLGAQNSGRPEA